MLWSEEIYRHDSRVVDHLDIHVRIYRHRLNYVRREMNGEGKGDLSTNDSQYHPTFSEEHSTIRPSDADD